MIHRWKRLLLVTVVSITVNFAVSMRAYSADSQSAFSIPALPLAEALNYLAKQSNRPLLFPYNDVRLLKTRGVSGNYTFEDALDQLLKGTGLQAHTTKEGVTTIVVGTVPDFIEQEDIMRKLSIKSKLISGASAAILATTGAAPSVAQTADRPTIQDDEIIVIGSRRSTPDRSTLNSAVPIDSISAKDLEAQGNTDIIDTLISVIPSLNANREPISDAASLVRPVNLRALPSDHTLVLVNGKRRHRGAVVGEFVSGVNAGAQGVDINPLFGTSVKSVEVLRDGAAAQYGSDAIAGVMNYNLISDADVKKVTLRYGQAYEGDGTTLEASGAFGTELGDGGFGTIAFQFKDQEATSRGVQDGEGNNAGATALAAAGFPVADPVVIWGQPNVKNDFKLALNSAIPAGDGEVYAFGTYATRDVDGSFFYRNPVNRGGSFTSGGDILFADTTGAGCPTIAPDSSSFAAFQAQLDSAPANCFTFHEFFPGGYTPRFGGVVNDKAMTAGFRGDLENGLGYDFSVGYGQNDVAYRMTNSINASLGPDSPTAFDLGAQTQTELVANADFNFGFEAGLASPLNVAFGAQYHDDEFKISAGDRAASVAGPFAAQGFTIGSNGFSGFGDDVAGSFTRDSLGLYLDLEADVTEAFLLTGALRFEDFSDFGSTTNVKLAGRYSLSDNFNVRGSYSTGFRAPTLGQSNLQRNATAFSGGQLVSSLTLASTNPIAQFFGGGQLNPEKSDNISIGATAEFGGFDFTVDYYDIKVEDRIAQTNASVTAADVIDLTNAGIANAGDLSSVSFFVNDFDSKTKGLDIVGNYGFESGLGNTDLTLAFNWNDTKVTSSGNTISAVRVREIEDALPSVRTTFTAAHRKDNLGGIVRLNYYGKATENLYNEPGGFFTETDALIIVDAEVNYDFSENFNIAVGAKNLLDTYPDEWDVGGTTGRCGGCLGAIYPLNHPAGFNGGSYYLRLSSNF